MANPSVTTRATTRPVAMRLSSAPFSRLQTTRCLSWPERKTCPPVSQSMALTLPNSGSRVTVNLCKVLIHPLLSTSGNTTTCELASHPCGRQAPPLDFQTSTHLQPVLQIKPHAQYCCFYRLKGILPNLHGQGKRQYLLSAALQPGHCHHERPHSGR